MRIMYCLVLLIMSALPLHAQERITTFMSAITVNADATINVQETIEVISTGDTVIHGIVREFPTSYADHYVTNYTVGFDVQSVTQDGLPAQFWIESVGNGKKIYIGDKDLLLSEGKHVYTITYTTNRQIGFFNNHDELYWNVTGNGWRLPIDKVRASIQLPSYVPSYSIAAEGYTGLQSEQGQNYTYAIDGNQITFSTTQPLEPYEGLTIVVTWPKGFVLEPAWHQKWYWFLQDNLVFIWTTLAFLLMLMLVLHCFMYARRKNKQGTIIPLFYPPTNFTPSLVGFMKDRLFKDQLLAADIVNLAVRGFITISCKPSGFFYTDKYTLTLVKDLASQKEHLSEYESGLLRTLFDIDTYGLAATTLAITKQNSSIIEAALEKVDKQCLKQTKPYIVTLNNILYFGYALCFLWLAPVIISAFFLHNTKSCVALFFGLFLFVLASHIKRFYRVYTPEGRKIQDQIDGFELYLKTAEIERMNIIGTPPTKTPELYEHYLPYAIALGVEEQWTQQFASVFTALAQEGHPYSANWYAGRPFRFYSFASDIGSSFNRAIATSSTSPGSSSGSGGRGRSGGGGGGGGGGGW
jgi:uncharacterized membrane protein YgcG